MVKLSELRRCAVEELRKLNNDSPRADIDFVLSALLGFGKTEILLGERALTDDEYAVFNSALLRLKTGEPVQYIAGKCEFMSLDFKVSPDVLIPRSDTEVLTETVINICSGIPTPHILEIGCGSGCISVSLAHYVREAMIYAVDISEAALCVARENARRHGAEARTDFFRYDIMQGFPDLAGGIDVIVSNPPYIPANDIAGLERKVREFEPLTALDGGADGLIFYRKIAECSVLRPGGYLAFEVGINQAEDVGRIMESRFTDIKIIKDINKIDRVVIGRFNGGNFSDRISK